MLKKLFELWAWSQFIEKNILNCRTNHDFRIPVQIIFVKLERVAGVEPASLAWEARVIPIYDTRFDIA